MQKKSWLFIAVLAGVFASIAEAGEFDKMTLDKDRNVIQATPEFVRRTYFPASASAPVEMRATSLKAFTVAWNAFIKAPEVPQNKKDLDRYLAVYVGEDRNNYYVFFFPKQQYPDERRGEVVLDGMTYFGQQALYTIRKGDYKIVKRYLYWM